MPDSDLRIIIPTRDSAAWIGALAAAYDRAGVRPLFIVDSRSSDGTLAELQTLDADTVEVSPSKDYVEDIVWRVPSLTGARWILRFDDDEMPSAKLLEWVCVNLHTFTLPIAFQRRWLLQGSDGTLLYAKHKHLYYLGNRPQLLDPQVRLYQPDRVRYTRQIHTPGFTVEDAMCVAPPDAFICHFDWITRTTDERFAKLKRYDAELPGCGMQLLYYYLPELLPLAERHEEPLGTTEFDALAATFAARRYRVSTEAAGESQSDLAPD